jgi:polar amino acid transport system substrate-binding protein
VIKNGGKMKKYIAVVLCAWGIMMGAASASFGETLSVGTSEWPPYGDLKDGKAIGFATEIIDKVLPKIGFDAKIEFMPWKRATEMAKNGEVDAIYSASYNAERAEFLHYPETPLHPSEYVFFIRKADAGKLKYDNFDDLKAYKIGVTRAYAYSDELNKKLEEFKNSEEANTDELNFEKLDQGRIDYFPADLLNGMALLEKLGLKDKIVYLDKRIKVKDYFIAFSKKSPKMSPEFVKKFSDQLSAFIQTDEYKKIHDRYYKQ